MTWQFRPFLALYDPFGVDVPLNFDITHTPAHPSDRIRTIHRLVHWRWPGLHCPPLGSLSSERDVSGVGAWQVPSQQMDTEVHHTDPAMADDQALASRVPHTSHDETTVHFLPWEMIIFFIWGLIIVKDRQRSVTCATVHWLTGCGSSLVAHPRTNNTPCYRSFIPARYPWLSLGHLASSSRPKLKLLLT